MVRLWAAVSVCVCVCVCVASYYNKETTNIVSLTEEDFIFNTF